MVVYAAFGCWLLALIGCRWLVMRLLWWPWLLVCLCGVMVVVVLAVFAS